MSLQKKIAIGTILTAAIITIWFGGNRSVLTGNLTAMEESTEIPILLLHHMVQDEPVMSESTISLEYFEDLLSTLHSEGFQTIEFDKLIAYTENKGELPKKPIIITFDDGYESTIVLAKPVLEQYHMQATVFAIGGSVGKTTYKDTGIPITPHFTWEQVAEARNVISVQSHSYDMHHVRQLDLQDFRSGVLRKESENASIYRKAFRKDIARFKKDMRTNLHTTVKVFAYPYGLYTETSESMLKEAGFKATVTTEHGINHVTKGDPDSLYAMKRIEVTQDIPLNQLMKWLSDTH
jgi:peptidoglycan/xylan/chitin deacetylase (PgdA/CDA1 family)